MATVGPVLVSDQSNTAGTGSLSLNNTSSDGRRGLADAVTNGDAANTNTVHYLIVDSGTSGASLDFEKGIGTISDAGATLSRDTVHQSSNGGAKVSWAGGGTRDVLIAVGLEDLVVAANNGTEFTAATFATNLGLPRLSAANTYTATQSVVGARPRFLVYDAGSTALGGLLAAVDNWIGLVTNISFDGTNFNLDDTSLPGWYLKLDPRAGQDAMEIHRASAGTNPRTPVLMLKMTSGGVLQDGSGNKFDAFPSGQVLLSESVPTGWTRGDVTGGRLIKLAASGDTLGAQAGSDDPFNGGWATQGHVLTVSEIPNHTHPSSSGSPFLTDTPAGTLASPGVGSQLSTESNTGGAGGGNPHSHSMTIPNYRVMGRIVKS